MTKKSTGGGTRLKAGDVLEIADVDAKWFLCYIGRHELLGDAVWVRAQATPLDAVVECDSFRGDGYFAFYRATAAVRRGLIRRVAFCPDGMRVMPRLLCFDLSWANAGRPRWKLAEDVRIGSPFVIRETLSPEEALIPRGEMWNHAGLLRRLRSNWHPSVDASDAV